VARELAVWLMRAGLVSRHAAASSNVPRCPGSIPVQRVTELDFNGVIPQPRDEAMIPLARRAIDDCQDVGSAHNTL
jgi:hypothetical protein